MNIGIPSCNVCGQREACRDALENGVCIYGPEIQSIFTLTLGHFQIDDFSLVDYWVEEVQGILARFIRKRSL